MNGRRKNRLTRPARRTRRARSGFAGVVCALLLFCFALPAQAQKYERCRTPRDLVFILDHSGTMNVNDPEGLRWIGLQKLILRLLADTDRDDRLVFIPFGSAKDTKKYLTQNGELRWFKLKEPKDQRELSDLLRDWRRERTHSDSTDIFAAFQTFAREFHPAKQLRSDLYIFFISDGKMDVGKPRRGRYDQTAIRARDRRLFDLLEKYQNLWRIYSICIGRNVDEARHRKMLAASKIQRRRSGLPYPPLGHTSPGEPYYLRINDKNPRVNLALFQDAIWDALDIGGAVLYRGQTRKGGVTFPAAPVDDYRFHFSLAKPMRPQELLTRITVTCQIDKKSLPVSLWAEHVGPENEPSPYLDFRVDTNALKKSQNGKFDPTRIREWKLDVAGLPADQEVVSLQIIQRNGWRVYIDSLRIEPAPLPRRALDRFSNEPQPCSATLWASGWAYSECGQGTIADEDRLALTVNDGASHPMKIERERTYDQVTNEPSFVYYWKPQTLITGDPAFPGNLGATVTLALQLSAFGGYLYQNHSIAVPVCALYETAGR